MDFCPNCDLNPQTSPPQTQCLSHSGPRLCPCKPAIPISDLSVIWNSIGGQSGLTQKKELNTCLFTGFSSSLGTMSIKKSNWSNLEMAIAISFLWNRTYRNWVTKCTKQQTKLLITAKTIACCDHSNLTTNTKKSTMSKTCILQVPDSPLLL